MTGHDRTWQDMTGHDRTWQMWSICPICSAQLFQRKFPKPAGVCQAREIFRKAMPSSTPSFLQAGRCQMSAQVNWKILHFHPQCRDLWDYRLGDLWDYRLGLSIELLETSLILSSGQHATSGESWISVALALRSPSRKQVGCDTGIAAICFRTL